MSQIYGENVQIQICSYFIVILSRAVGHGSEWVMRGRGTADKLVEG